MLNKECVISDNLVILGPIWYMSDILGLLCSFLNGWWDKCRKHLGKM